MNLHIDLLTAADVPVLDTLLADPLPGKRLEALLQLLDSRAREEGLQGWLQWSSDPTNAGVNAAPRQRQLRPRAMAAAQVEEDLMSGVKSYLHIQRCVFANTVLSILDLSDTLSYCDVMYQRPCARHGCGAG